MEHNKDLPALHDLLNLANSSQFPSTRDNIVESAKRTGVTDAMVDFLNLFSADTVFDSKVDFMTRSEELEMFIEQEKDLPKELTRNP